MIRTITTAVIDCDAPECDETFMDRIDLNESGAHHLAILHGWTFKVDSKLRTKSYFCRQHSKEQLKKNPLDAAPPPG